jgi:hypothetical protein
MCHIKITKYQIFCGLLRPLNTRYIILYNQQIESNPYIVPTPPLEISGVDLGATRGDAARCELIPYTRKYITCRILFFSAFSNKVYSTVLWAACVAPVSGHWISFKGVSPLIPVHFTGSIPSAIGPFINVIISCGQGNKIRIWR